LSYSVVRKEGDPDTAVRKGGDPDTAALNELPSRNGIVSRYGVCLRCGVLNRLSPLCMPLRRGSRTCVVSCLEVAGERCSSGTTVQGGVAPKSYVAIRTQTDKQRGSVLNNNLVTTCDEGYIPECMPLVTTFLQSKPRRVKKSVASFSMPKKSSSL